MSTLYVSSIHSLRVPACVPEFGQKQRGLSLRLYELNTVPVTFCNALLWGYTIRLARPLGHNTVLIVIATF